MAYTTINKSTDHFNTKLFTANASTQSITGVGFQPDMVWGKSRGQSYDHEIYDAVRGVYKRIKTNQNHAEVSDNANLTSFDSDGFSLGSATNMNYSNGDNIVSWNWKANGQGSANSDGSTTTTYTSANTASGFSIIKYGGTGSSATIGHGLGATPKVCIFKQLDGTESWRVWHRDAPNYSTKATALNLTSAEFDQTGWVGTVNNSTIQLGSDGSINLNAKNYICYAFAEKTGFSRFGSYTGNANADGTFIYTGFKPAMIIIKNADANENWSIYDNKRLGYNPAYNRLYPSLSDAEVVETRLDTLSNGFKMRSGTAGHLNTSQTFIYMAFAEAPLVGSNNVPCTAR